MRVAVIDLRLVQNAPVANEKRLPRKNDPASIAARREALGLERRRRPRAVREGGGVGDGHGGHPRLGRAAARLARRLRALRGRRRRRDRPRRGGRRRAARAHRGRADRVAPARREGGRGVGRLPDVRRRRPDHARVVLRLPRRRRRARARALDRGPRRRDARLAARRRHPGALEACRAARGEDARRRADVPRALALHDGRRGRAEHDDPQRVRAEHGVRVAQRPGRRSSESCSRRTWAATRSRRTSTSSPATARR